MPNRPLALNLTVLTGMILAVALTRLIPHPPNFSPVEAMALFGGAYFARKSLAILVPLVALFVSDLALGLLMGGEYFSYFVSAGFWLVYLTIAVLAVLGFGLRKRRHAPGIGQRTPRLAGQTDAENGIGDQVERKELVRPHPPVRCAVGRDG
ncbi:MAG: DUF6580 family putative transport protein, partial [Arenimonas sp.]